MPKRPARERLPRQFGTDPENARIVRRRAEVMKRPIEAELDHLLTVGIKADPEVMGNENQWDLLRAAAHGSTPMHGAAPRGIQQHENEPIKRPA